MEMIQQDIEQSYDMFCNVVDTCMKNTLPSKTVHIKSGLHAKRRQTKKPWWNSTLDDIFAKFVELVDRKWSRATGAEKVKLKADWKRKQNEFDREKQ